MPDPYENKPEKKPWEIRFTKLQLSKLFQGKHLGEIEELKVTGRSVSGRVLALLVKGTAGSLVL